MASNVTTIKKRKLVPQELTKIGENAYNKMEKVNSELVSMAYGALVTQLLKDFEKVEDVNFQLEKMGYRIGNRLIDEYMSKTNSMSCETFQETAESIARIGFKIFLGITARVENCYKPQEVSHFSFLHFLFFDSKFHKKNFRMTKKTSTCLLSPLIPTNLAQENHFL